MKKKISLFLGFLFIILLLIGLIVFFVIRSFYRGYTGKHPNLYTVAINSVLYTSGHSFGADRYMNSKIEIIDEDEYGRTIFTYSENYYGKGYDDVMTFRSLLVCQHANKNEVFYYEDVNYMIKPQASNSEKIEDFSNEEIETLKELNDWNEELNLTKCIKKAIIKNKPDIPYKEEIENKIVEEFDLDSYDKEYYIREDFLTHDSNNTNFIIYGYVSSVANDNKYQVDVFYIGLVEVKDNKLAKISFFVPSNVYDCKEEFIEFKKANNWS